MISCSKKKRIMGTNARLMRPETRSRTFIVEFPGDTGELFARKTQSAWRCITSLNGYVKRPTASVAKLRHYKISLDIDRCYQRRFTGQ